MANSKASPKPSKELLASGICTAAPSHSMQLSHNSNENANDAEHELSREDLPAEAPRH